MSTTQRDIFFDTLYDLAKEDRDVLLVSADMGAPSLDKFRRDLALQYIDVGIAEQQAVAMASGLGHSGKKVFAYAIAPFITFRPYEFTRLNLAAMNIPVTLVGVGSGVSYDDSGPTHHMVEDLSIMRILPNFKIFNITDGVMAEAMAKISCKLDHPNYVRLDRKTLPDLYSADTDFTKGAHLHAEGGDCLIVATGNMVHRALEVREELAKQGVAAGVMDAYTFPVASGIIAEAASKVGSVVTLEEHTLPGGLGGAVCEALADEGVVKPIKRIGMDFSKGYCYKYGGRDEIQRNYALDVDGISKTVMESIKG